MQDAAVLPALIIGLAAGAVAFFKLWRRAPKDGRCGTCAYTTQGLTSDRCPECGSPRGCKRPIRARWVALCAALLYLAFQTPWWQERSSEPWYTRLIPTTAFCVAERISPSRPDTKLTLSSFRFHLLRTRHADGAWAWQSTLAAGNRFPAELAESCVVTPDVWPEGESIVVRARWPNGVGQNYPNLPAWADIGVGIDSPLVPKTRAAVGARAFGVSCGLRTGLGPPGDVIVLPPQPVGEFEATLHLTSRISRALTLEREIRRRIRIVPRGTPILKPFDSPQFCKAFTSDVHIYLNTIYVCVQPPSWFLKSFPDVATGTKVQLLWKGKPFGEFQSPRTVDDEWQYFELPEEAKESEAVAERTKPVPAELTVRMTGDEATSLRYLSGTHYWSGSIELPMTEWLRVEAEAFEAWKRANP